MARKSFLFSISAVLRLSLILLAVSPLWGVTAETAEEHAQKISYYRGYEKDAQRVLSHFETTCDAEDEDSIQAFKKTLTQYTVALDESAPFSEVEGHKKKSETLIARILRNKCA